MLHKALDVDKFILVGGYRFDDLAQNIKLYFFNYIDRLVLINNKRYNEFGSGYSLYLGLKSALQFDPDEIIFAEGDLYFDSYTFEIIEKSSKDVITICDDQIIAQKAVALYTDINGMLHYVYDNKHGSLFIKEPFTGIFNSGQVWKFMDLERVKKCINEIDDIDWGGTNLTFIEKYFGNRNSNEYEIIKFNEWINCNTIEDWKRIPKNEKLT